MKRIFRLLVVFTVIAGFLVFGFLKVKRWLEIDACLDSGGSWNYKENRCEHGTNSVVGASSAKEP
jgi:hypothetical protein